MDSPSRLAHEAQEPEIREDRVFEAQPLLVCRLRAEMTALGCESQFESPTVSCTDENAQVFWSLAVPPQKD